MLIPFFGGRVVSLCWPPAPASGFRDTSQVGLYPFASLTCVLCHCAILRCLLNAPKVETVGILLESASVYLAIAPKCDTLPSASHITRHEYPRPCLHLFFDIVESAILPDLTVLVKAK